MTRPETSIGLDREAFLEMLAGLLSSLNELLLSPEAAAGYVHQISLAMGARIEKLYKDQRGLNRPFTVEEYAEVLADLKRRIEGDFEVVVATPEKVRLEGRICPLEEMVRQSPSLCRLTAGIFGSIGARNFGYAKVVNDAFASGDHHGCGLTIYLQPTEEALGEPGEEYFEPGSEASTNLQEQLSIMERLGQLRDELRLSKENYRHLYERQKVLNRISMKLASSLDRQALLGLIVEAACELLRAPAAAILRRDAGKGRLSARAVFVAAKGHLPPEAVQIPERGSGALEAMSSSRVTQVADTTLEPSLVLPKLPSMEIRSLASIPIQQDGEISGVLEVYFSRPRVLTDEEMELISSLGASATIALTNARLYEREREALKTRDEFLTMASHELRTPLTTVRGLVDLLLRREQKGQPLDRNVLLTVKGQLRRITTLVNDLLDISSLEEGHLEIQPEPTDIVAIARGVVDRIQEQSPRHKIEIEAPEELIGTWDPRRLEQVLANLIHNAVKYSPGGRKVIVGIYRHDEGVHISVRDFGIGIPERDRETLFRRFSKGSNVRAKRFGGLGLGLSISREIVELHGGRIWVESEEDRGSIFHVLLPLGGPPAGLGAPAVQEAAGPAS